MYKLALFLSFFFCLPLASAENCPSWLNHTLPRLHSAEEVNLCNVINKRPVLLVNTASYCGFTHQFSGLQALHQRYEDKGLVVIGFPSNDFRQEAGDEKTTASICYENYGVGFTMVSPVKVKGQGSHSIFKHLADNSKAPRWNFNKYLISADGNTITHFGSTVAPESTRMTKAIDQLLARSQ